MRLFIKSMDLVQMGVTTEDFIPQESDGFQITDLFGTDGFVATLLTVAIAIALVMSVIFLVVGGYQYILSGGEKGKADKAKKTIQYALIGVAVVLLAAALQATVVFVLGTI
jgi:hypothetical protein